MASGRVAMFTVGRIYEFTIWTGGAAGVGGHHSHVGKVVEIDMPLVKFADTSGAEAIVNVTSLAFVGAKLAEDAA